MHVKPILGTMNFGPQVQLSDSIQMVTKFIDSGFNEIDTAYVYNNGDSERYLGEALNHVSLSQPVVATKVNPRITGKLDRESIQKQLLESIQRLGLNSVDILYLHFPDPTTPIFETLSCCFELYKKGYFKELGLSNFPAWQVVKIWYICKENGWMMPTIYQGLYNGLSRNVEEELLPSLRSLGMRFYAYNPLAGGILSGKYSDIDNIKEGRFTHRPNYQSRYWKKEFFDAYHLLNLACERHGISIIEAAFRWLIGSSSLQGINGDSIIIGASSIDQLNQNLSFFDGDGLDIEVLDAFNNAWEISKSEAPAYFRNVK
ncbi:aldo/keto reductase family protein [Vibrio fluminensis]|uniref:aldo/keto reductase family protein n=1 Tax=Vibrio fluminensis TaxID=2783614 RepID=UPI001887045F|nr:aldo/keto reductase [Vibrio fluminensis]